MACRCSSNPNCSGFQAVNDRPPVIANPWQSLRRLTPARIALGRAGSSLPTAAHLAFQLDHARARDAVQCALDIAPLRVALLERGLGAECVHSAAADRRIYLQRPDQGRRLDASSRQHLLTLAAARASGSDLLDLVLVLADGLSARGVQRHAIPLVDALLERLSGAGWTLGPLVIAQQARVALGDEIAALLGARMVAMLIGERPGLSAPDSLGVYLTWAPRVGTPDSARNCLSNIRAEGLAFADAADQLAWLMREARRRGATGTALKQDHTGAPTPIQTQDPPPLMP